MTLWEEEERISRAELRLRCRTFSRTSEAECLRSCLLTLAVISPVKDCRPLCCCISQCGLCRDLHCEQLCTNKSLLTQQLDCAHGESSHNNRPLAKRGKYNLSVHQQHLKCHHDNHLQSRQWEVDGGECCTHTETHIHTDLKQAACN